MLHLNNRSVNIFIRSVYERQIFKEFSFVSGWIVCPVGLAGWFVDEINGLYAVHTYIDFHDLCKNAEIRNSLEKITVPKIINLDISQEYLLNKLHNEGIDIDYV